MKTVITTRTVAVILTLMAIAAAIAAVTGVQGVHWRPGSVTVTHHNVSGRLLAVAIGAICGVAAYGCNRRKLYAWWIVATMLGLLGFYAIIWSVWTISTAGLDLIADALGVLAFAVKIGFIGWLLIAQWLPRKKEFS